jgi:hypothetical protein
VGFDGSGDGFARVAFVGSGNAVPTYDLEATKSALKAGQDVYAGGTLAAITSVKNWTCGRWGGGSQNLLVVTS